MTPEQADDYFVAQDWPRPDRYVVICDACGIGAKVMSFARERSIAACPFCGGSRREATRLEVPRVAEE